MKVTSYLKYEGLDKFYRGQLDFTTLLVLPLWKEICNILPDLEEMLSNVCENIVELKHKIATENS
jgi:hypothetical protein